MDSNSFRGQGELDEPKRYIDASLASGRGEQIGLTRRGNCVKRKARVDRHGLPLAVITHAANYREVTLVQLTLDLYMIEGKLRTGRAASNARPRTRGGSPRNLLGLAQLAVLRIVLERS
jgi:hypothetical protein